MLYKEDVLISHSVAQIHVHNLLIPNLGARELIETHP